MNAGTHASRAPGSASEPGISRATIASSVSASSNVKKDMTLQLIGCWVGGGAGRFVASVSVAT